MAQTSNEVVVCLDLDGSLLNGNWNNVLADCVLPAAHAALGTITDGQSINPLYDAKRVEEETKKLLADTEHYGIKNEEGATIALRALHDMGVKFAVTSFTQYPTIVPIIFERLGFSETEIKAMITVTGNPPKGAQSDKNPHFEIVKEKTGVSDNRNILVLDDSETHIEAAAAVGMVAIRVPEHNNPAPKYLSELVDKAREMKIRDLSLIPATVEPKAMAAPAPAKPAAFQLAAPPVGGFAAKRAAAKVALAANQGQEPTSLKA